MAAQIREVEQSRQEMVRSVLEVGFPRRSRSSIQIHWFLVLPGPAFHLPALLMKILWTPICLSWIPFPAHQGAGLISGENVGRAGREGSCQMGQYPLFVNLFTSGGGEHGLGKFLSILDTFIFPESNSASDSARPGRGLFSTWKPERDKQVKDC